jgi:hypothetical protein
MVIRRTAAGLDPDGFGLVPWSLRHLEESWTFADYSLDLPW